MCKNGMCGGCELCLANQAEFNRARRRARRKARVIAGKRSIDKRPGVSFGQVMILDKPFIDKRPGVTFGQVLSKTR